MIDLDRHCCVANAVFLAASSKKVMQVHFFISNVYDTTTSASAAEPLHGIAFKLSIRLPGWLARLAKQVASIRRI
jgi:hypothetical protein